MSGSGPARLRVHFQSNPKAPTVFHVTDERYRAAAARHPELAERVEPTIGWTVDELHQALPTAEVLVGFRFPRMDLAAVAPALRWIHIWGAGVEHLRPFDWLPKGVALTNNRGVHAPKAGEYAAMALLLLNQGVPAMMTNQRAARWEERFTTVIAGKTVLIVGVGEMGGAAARQAKRLGLRVLGIRRGARPHRAVDEMFGPDALAAVLPRADFVLVTTPLTRETEHLIGRRELDRMKRSAGVINMSRAQVVDYGALAEKLADGSLAGAVIDVCDPEPLPADAPLWGTPNLVITPHCGSDDAEHYMPRTLDLVFRNVERYLAGRPLLNRVRLARQY